VKRPRLSGPPVLVKYGKVIPYEELMKDGAEAAMVRLRDEVVKLKGELDGLRSGAPSVAPGHS